MVPTSRGFLCGLVVPVMLLASSCSSTSAAGDGAASAMGGPQVLGIDVEIPTPTDDPIQTPTTAPGPRGPTITEPVDPPSPQPERIEEATQVESTPESAQASDASDRDPQTSDGDDASAATDSAPTEPPASDSPPSDSSESELNDEEIAAPASLQAAECRFSPLVPLPTQPECYDLTVPENRSKPSASSVSVHIALFRSTGESLLGDPVIYLEGGPGGHALDMLSFTYASIVEPYLGARDVIVFDQRGAGRSEPQLSCPEATEADVLNAAVLESRAAEDERARDALRACAKRLRADGHDLGAFNSTESAHDLADLIDLFGYDEVNLLGISYGTRLAQTAMRLYPESIRSVVLDSVVPIKGSVLTTLADSAENALGHLWDACVDDDACAEQYPNLADRFVGAVAQLDEQPLAYEATNLLDGDTQRRTADGGDLVGLVFNALYSTASFAVIPQLIDEVERGETTVLEALGSQQATQADLFSVGMYFAVTCHEEAPFEAEAETSGDDEATSPFDLLTDHSNGAGFLGTCAAWDVPEADAVENVAITSGVPTLIMGGSYDPITPISGGRSVATALDTVHVVEFPHEGHGPGVTPCGTDVINRFFDTPRRAPSTPCLGDDVPVFVAEPTVGPVEMIDFAAEATGVRLRGSRPAGWSDLGGGQFARNQNLIDPTVLLFQNTFGAPASDLVAAYSSALGLEASAAPSTQIWDPRGPWQTFVGSTGSDIVTIAVREAGFDGIAIVLVARAEEQASLVEYVLVPAALAAES